MYVDGSLTSRNSGIGLFLSQIGVVPELVLNVSFIFIK